MECTTLMPAPDAMTRDAAGVPQTGRHRARQAGVSGGGVEAVAAEVGVCGGTRRAGLGTRGRGLAARDMAPQLVTIWAPVTCTWPMTRSPPRTSCTSSAVLPRWSRTGWLSVEPGEAGVQISRKCLLTSNQIRVNVECHENDTLLHYGRSR